MRARRRTKATPKLTRRQLNLRVDPNLYEAIAVLARNEQRPVAQVAQRLVSEALGHRLNEASPRDDAAGAAIAPLAAAGGAFTWLAAEPDLYDDTSGEPL